MSSKLDQSLDDVIKSNPGRRGGRGGARNGGARRSSNGAAPPSDAGHPLSRSEESSNGSGPVRRERRSNGGGRQGGTPYQRPDSYRQPRNFDDDAEWKHDMHQQEQAAQARLNADKIYVANLDADVNEDDVKEIFGKVGKISKVVINFNQQGKSLGTAEVTFARKGDAEKAVTEYDGAEVDSRPMQVKLVGTMVQPRVVKKRTPPPQQYQPQQQQQQYQQRPRQQQGGNFQQRPRQSRGGGGGGNRTGGRGGGSGGGRRNDKGPTPTAESLDAELDNWNNNKSAPATTTAAAAGQPTSAAAAGQPSA